MNIYLAVFMKNVDSCMMQNQVQVMQKMKI